MMNGCSRVADLQQPPADGRVPTRRRTALRAATLGMLLSVLTLPALAHKASDAYLQLSGAPGKAGTLRVDVALRDLDVPLDLDADGDGRLTAGEVRQAWPAIERYVRANVRVDGCTLGAATQLLERRSDGVYAALRMPTDCTGLTGAPVIAYTVLADVDPTHRGLAHVTWAGTAPQLRVLSAAGTVASVAASGAIDVTASGPGAADATLSMSAFVVEGVQHILTGYDHVLFLLCLLLPAVMRRTQQGWQPVDRLGDALWPVARIVTAFTLAHSLTLALSAGHWVRLSPAFIEPAIAATIIVAALDNLRPLPLLGRHRMLMTFLFGLIHGFGFAGVLSELPLDTGAFVRALLAFNVGLELGQLAIVAAVATLCFGLRRLSHYPLLFIRGGSVAALLVAAFWLVERTGMVDL